MLGMNIVSREEARAMEGFYPFDLTAPAKLLYPIYTPFRGKAVIPVKSWIVDIDGTVALKGDRNPFDWTRVGEDLPNIPVVCVVEALLEYGHHVIFMSGRMEQARKQTELWLCANIQGVYIPDGQQLFMRADDDYRPDSIVKRELFEEHVLGNYDIIGVIDDRDSVVREWRSMGLTCFQVAEGDF